MKHERFREARRAPGTTFFAGRGTLALVLIGGLAVAGCGGARQGTVRTAQAEPAAADAVQTPPASPLASESMPSAEPQTSCPTALPGMAVRVRELPGGVALEFSGSAPELSELRSRVRQLASAEPGGGLTDSEHGPPIAAASWVEETEQGARLVLAATDQSQVESLRSHVREQAARLATGACPSL